jgi:hypothetical protein
MTDVLTPKRKKPANYKWKDKERTIAVNEKSVYGVRYWCAYCGNISRGWPMRHYQTCPVRDKKASL